MPRLVLLSIGLLMLLFGAPLAVISSLASGGPGWAAGAAALAVAVAVMLVRMWLGPSRRARSAASHRILHRGATKPDYDLWVGGGLGGA